MDKLISIGSDININIAGDGIDLHQNNNHTHLWPWEVDALLREYEQYKKENPKEFDDV